MAIPRRNLLGYAAGAAFCAACSARSASRASRLVAPSPAASSGEAPAAVPAAPALVAARHRFVVGAHGRDVTHGPRTKHAVALTFHGAGDPAIARSVLSEAARAGAHLTVLAVGTWLAAEPATARRILDGGHDLGNHTWSHRPMRSLGPAAARREVLECAALLTRLTGHHGSWFRPSGTPSSTATIRAAATSAGYPFCLTYDVDSLDYTDPGASAITRWVLAQVRPGSIVSMHLGHAGTVAALPQILDGLRRRALAAVSATELLS